VETGRETCPKWETRGAGSTVVVSGSRVSDALSMNGYIIETRVPDTMLPGRFKTRRWIGISKSAQAMIAVLPGDNPSVIDRGPEVLAMARMMGLLGGQVRDYRKFQE
jgi:hypothetical protein